MSIRVPFAILHVVATLDPKAGGVTSLVLQLSAALSRLGHRVTIICLDDPSAEWIVQTEVRIVALGRPLFGHRFSVSFSLIAALLRDSKIYDYVIVHGVWQFQTVLMSFVLPRNNVPYLVYAHGMLTDTSFKWSSWKYLKKLVYWHLCEARSLAKARMVIFTSSDEMAASAGRCEKKGIRTLVVRNGIENPRFETESDKLQVKKLGLPDRYLLALGRLHPIKGLEIAIAALAKLGERAPCLVIAGDGDVGYKAKLEEMVVTHGIGEKVHFIGHISGNEKFRVISMADALLAPSHHENFGIALVEALALGVPVLTNRHVGIWREIEQCGAGVLFANTIAGCASAISLWMGCDEYSRTEYRNGALECFSRYFSIDTTASVLAAELGRIRDDKKTR